MKDKKLLLNKIITIILWLLIALWITFCIIDFVKTENHKKPIFCINEKTIEYKDGIVYSCTGLGYKIYHYNRASFTGIEYGPFWLKDRSNNMEDE